MLALLVAAACLAVGPAVARPQPPAAAEADADAADLFVVTYRPGPAWQEGRPMAEQGLMPHGRYMRSLLDQGRLEGGGPFVGSEGGMMILRAADRAEAEAVVAADPAVTGGIFVAGIEHWWPRFRAESPLPAPRRPAP